MDSNSGCCDYASMMLEDRYQGCIVGLAVGDALGYPAEFRSRAQILREIGPHGITDFIAQKDRRFTRPMIIGRDHPPARTPMIRR
jgi:ADP-ribosylglycohydrolase